jgi:hypothetical protein
LKTAQKFERPKFSLLGIRRIQFNGLQFHKLLIRTRLSSGMPTARMEKEQSRTEQNEDWDTSHEAFQERIEDGAIMPPVGPCLNPKIAPAT